MSMETGENGKTFQLIDISAMSLPPPPPPPPPPIIKQQLMRRCSFGDKMSDLRRTIAQTIESVLELTRAPNYYYIIII